MSEYQLIINGERMTTASSFEVINPATEARLALCPKADISDGTCVVDEEPFGPILPIIGYSTTDDAIRLANESPYGLGGSVWSGDIEHALRLAGRLECGTVWINSHAAPDPNVPFGGVKQSGFGVEFGLEGLGEYTTSQSVFIPKSNAGEKL